MAMERGKGKGSRMMAYFNCTCSPPSANHSPIDDVGHAVDPLNIELFGHCCLHVGSPPSGAMATMHSVPMAHAASTSCTFSAKNLAVSEPFTGTRYSMTQVPTDVTPCTITVMHA